MTRSNTVNPRGHTNAAAVRVAVRVQGASRSIVQVADDFGQPEKIGSKGIAGFATFVIVSESIHV